MNLNPTYFAFAAVAVLAAGCATPLPPGAERGPHNTMAYDVWVEASAPGAQIEVNGELIGRTPVHVKIFGDADGTFHDFGSEFFEIRALPVGTNQFSQLRLFQTGHLLSPQDRIPQRIYFDMNQPPPRYEPGYGYPPPVYYYGPPGYYYGPGPFFYGPSFRFDIGPGHYHGWRGHGRRR